LVNGADSIYLFSPTGQGYLFSDKLEEKNKLVNLTLEITGKKTPLIIGIFGNEVDKIIEEVEDFGKKFNDLNFTIYPPLNQKISEENLKSYFTNILDSVNTKNPLYLYNNPEQFAGNEITPEIIKELMKSSNLYGIIDSFDNINFGKSYIQLINERFSIFCSKGTNFQKFFQLIPIEKRKYCGIIPNISNLVNVCSKLYYCAIEDKILELHKLQEQVNDIRTKIYDIKFPVGQRRRGLKYAFLYLYKDNISDLSKEYNIVSPMLHRELDDISKGRIEATTNYLLNQKFIYQLFFLGKEEIYQLDDIINRFSSIEVLADQGKIKKIIGPLDADNNTIYRVNFENNPLIFRFRTSKFFLYENIVKEKLLFPILDRTINPLSKEIREKVKKIISTNSGTYMFNKQTPPIIPVANLIYYDETKDNVPYIFSVLDYIEGKSLKSALNQHLIENVNLNKTKFVNLFSNLGEILGKIHQIGFDSFHENIYNIGKKSNLTCLEIFRSGLDKELQEFSRIKNNHKREIEKYIKTNEALIEEESLPVLLHNDFQWSNIIIKNEDVEIQIKGLIDFDNWGIGVREQDFVKIEWYTLQYLNIKELETSFYGGYSRFFKINKDFKRKIEIYSLLWLLKKYNIEIKRFKSLEQSRITEKKENLSDSYLNEIKRITTY